MITVKELHRQLEALMAEDPGVANLDFSTCGVSGTLRILRDVPGGKITGLSLEDDSFMEPFVERAEEALRLSGWNAISQKDMEYLIEMCAQDEDPDPSALIEFIEEQNRSLSFLDDASVIEYKGILFDEWTIDKESSGGVYSEMCEHCAKKYKDVLSNELSEGGMGACSVKGCDVVGMDADTETHFYVDFDPKLIRVVETIEKAREEEKAPTASIYLQQNPDATWQAYIGVEPVAQGDVKLCDEKEYPVDLYYYRYDMNGSRILEKDVCQNREELLKSLDWTGQCRNTVATLWNFDDAHITDPDVHKIFVDAYATKCEIAANELARSDVDDLLEKFAGEYRGFSSPHELICFPEKMGNRDFITFARAALNAALSTNEMNYIGKFILQHLHQEVQVAAKNQDRATLRGLHDLVRDVYAKHADKLKHSLVMYDYQRLMEFDFEKLFMKPSLNAQIQSASDRTAKNPGHHNLIDHEHNH